MKEQDLLADLNDAQREAVTHMEGPLLILAAAGSGKTRVITRRVANLLHQGVHPGNILAITFTNKAAGEMQKRVEELMPGNRVWISTFHSFGARLLRQYADRIGLDRHFTIYDQADRLKIVKMAIEDVNREEMGRFSPESLSGIISKAKNQLLSPERFASSARTPPEIAAARVYPYYEKRLRDANAVDFDDLLYWPAMVLKNDQELRGELDSRFRYVLIDEYQDTNQAQYEIARRLSVDYPNLCVVGDPDQCLPPGTLVQTPKGALPIESIQDGDRVLSAIGHGDYASMPVDKVMRNPYKGKLVRLQIEGGLVVRATPNHMCFAQHAMSMLLAEQRIGQPLDRFSFTPNTDFAPTRAEHLCPEMLVPVLVDGRIVERRVERVDWEDYDGFVYDLSVPETHNFVADGLVVHNSIYKFRGSDIRNILDFERDFPSARVMTLSLNYRSTKSILAAAAGLIAHNLQRKPKDLLTENPTGQKVTVLVYDTGTKEADDIARRIRASVESGRRRYRDFALLVRMNALTRALETACIQRRVPYQIVKGLAFFERKENRDVLAYLRLLVNPRDDVSFDRIVNEPPRGIGDTSMKHLRVYAESNELGLLSACNRVEFITAIKGKAMKALRDFYSMMEELSVLREAQPDEVIRQVLERTGYRQMLIDSRDEEDAQRLANVEELITAAHQFGQEDHSRTIADFLENITLASDLDGWDQNQDCVSIMTMHAAKGLEFPVVFLVAVEQGLIPHVRALESRKDEEIEEERRLAFVGITRAQQELYMTRAREREFRGQTLPAVESMFIRELPADAVGTEAHDSRSALDAYRVGSSASAKAAWEAAGVEIPLPLPPKPRGDDPYPVGSLVRHASYGVGRVVRLQGFGATRTVVIRFPSGEHKFRLSHVKLEMIRPA